MIISFTEVRYSPYPETKRIEIPLGTFQLDVRPMRYDTVILGHTVYKVKECRVDVATNSLLVDVEKWDAE